MSICRLEKISRSFKVGEEITPLKDISIEVNKGDFIYIEGPSGIGKSTLLYIMGLLLKQSTGNCFFDDKDVSSMTEDERSDIRAKRIGFLFQDSTLIQALTLRENLIFSQNITGKKDPARADEMIKRFGLEDHAGFLPHQLSGGQKRRAMAARCMLNSPELILADEPTDDLDSQWADQIMDMFREEAKKGNAVVLVTHNRDLAGYANRKYRLEDGKLRELS